MRFISPWRSTLEKEKHVEESTTWRELLRLVVVYNQTSLSGLLAVVNNKGSDIKSRLFHTQIPLVVHLKNIPMGAKLAQKRKKQEKELSVC